jgi:hypothetical protein
VWVFRQIPSVFIYGHSCCWFSDFLLVHLLFYVFGYRPAVSIPVESWRRYLGESVYGDSNLSCQDLDRKAICLTPNATLKNYCICSPHTHHLRNITASAAAPPLLQLSKRVQPAKQTKAGRCRSDHFCLLSD